MEKLCLEVQDLTKRYDASEFSLDHLNFKVPYGSVMGLIGENGAGKTTTLKLILNLMRRDAGTIKLFGLDNIRDEGAIKQQIGVVFDENHFHELFSPADIAKILRSLYQKWDDNLFQQYLRRFQLPADKPIKTYSRGMKVKLSIASALAHHPKLLLLDEPTSGLDLQHMKEVADELVTIQKMGKTSLVITHDYELIVSCCTHVLHLEHGMVQEQYALDAAGLQRLQNFFIESR